MARRLWPCLGLLTALALGGCQTLVQELIFAGNPELDHRIRSADLSHFRGTLLDDAIRDNWNGHRTWRNCAGGSNLFVDVQMRLLQRYGRERPEMVAADLTRQGASCVQTGDQAFTCTYGQTVYCKTRGWWVASKDHRSDVRLSIALRDHPIDVERYAVADLSQETELHVSD